jgi:hypothetical protein
MGQLLYLTWLEMVGEENMKSARSHHLSPISRHRLLPAEAER